MKDPYETLGVARDATPDDIRAARRRLASEHHPDKGGETEAMQDVNRAYELLIDPEARARFDETGDADPAKATLQQKAEEVLRELMRKALEATAPNLVVAVRCDLEGALERLEKKAPHITEAIAKTEAHRGRIRAPLGVPNVLHQLVDAKLRSLRDSAKENDSAIEVTHAALQLLAAYETDDPYIETLDTATSAFAAYFRATRGGR